VKKRKPPKKRAEIILEGKNDSEGDLGREETMRVVINNASLM
jgi:hypothetical protein